MRKLHCLLLATSCIASIVTASAASAQTITPAAADDSAADDNADNRDIVVTGSLIRGIAPAGSAVIGLNPADARAIGASTANDLLASLPQVGNFFNQVVTGVSGVAGSNGSIPIARPNLRNLPGGNTSGGAQTLVLLDGHRVVPLGTQQLAVDPEFIAPLVIQRVEALTDGGSAVYGSDALGGVINFITRDRFDGLQVDGRFGIADSSTSWEAGFLAGKDWGSGSAYIAYRHTQRDAIYGSDRDFVRRFDPLTGVNTGRNCAAGPNVSAGSGANARTYVLSGNNLVAGSPLNCDLSDDLTYIPSTRADNVFASLMQQLDDNLRFDVKLYYAQRAIRATNGTLGNGQLGTGAETTVTLSPTNPNYRPLPVGDVNFGLAQSVRFSLAPVLGARSATQDTNLDTFNITPRFTYDLGSDWQVQALFNYGRGTVDFSNAQINNPRGAGPLSTLAANGTLNPYAISATAAAAIRAYDVGIGVNEYFNYRAIVDGPLFQLPGGAVRVALGVEYGEDNFSRRQTNANTYVLSPKATYSQNVKSVFGEIQVPVLGEETSGVDLDVSVSGRYDDYNDVGGTFNPKVGVTFQPFEMLTIRGSWGQSFNAPTPADQVGIGASTAGPVPGAFLQFPPATPGRCGVTGLPACSATGVAGIFLGGTSPGLTPQTAENWSAGFDFRPVDGLYFSASYYHIDLNGTIGRPISGAILTDFYQGYPDLWLFQPTGQQAAAFIATVPAAGVSAAIANPTSTSQAQVILGFANGLPVTAPVQVLLDTRVTNLGRTKLDGIDFAAGFALPTGFGSIDGRIAGNYRLNQNTQTRPGGPTFDNLAVDATRYNLTANLGTTIGGFRAQATINHQPGFTRSPNAAGQARVSAFDIVNLFFGYNFQGTGLTENLSFNINVGNVFDEAPPLFLDAGAPGYLTDRTTIGRSVQFGINKRF